MFKWNKKVTAIFQRPKAESTQRIQLKVKQNRKCNKQSGLRRWNQPTNESFSRVICFQNTGRSSFLYLYCFIKSVWQVSILWACGVIKQNVHLFLCVCVCVRHQSYCNIGQYSFWNHNLSEDQRNVIRTYFVSNVYLIYSLPRLFSQAFRHINVAKWSD